LARVSLVFFDGITLDIVNNEVLVSLAVYTEEKINLFVDMILDAPFITFHQSPGLPELTFDFEQYYSSEVLHNFDVQIAALTSHVSPGDILHVRDSSGRLLRAGSNGYRISIDWQWQIRIGFVTAAHISNGPLGRPLRIGDRIYNSAGNHIGTIRYVNLHTADVAFFELINATSDRRVHFGTLGAREASNGTGNRVFLDAMHGTGRPGDIKAPWSGNTASGNWVSGLRASYQSQGGDSGGIVYSWTNATNNGVNGIHALGWPAGTWGDGGNAVFTTVSTHRSFLANGFNLH